jgi:hypothetical protein
MSSNSSSRRVVSAIGLLLVAVSTSPFVTAAGAQTIHGSVRGTVHDAAGQPVAGAALTVVREETGERRQAETGSSGEFTLAHLASGAHRLEIVAPGHAPYIRRLAVDVAQAIWIEARLGVTIAEQLRVSAPLRPESELPRRGTVVDDRLVSGLPLDGRNFLELALLAPGAVPSAPGSATSIRGDFAFNVNGGREDSNAYLLDGVYNVDPKLNGVGVRVPVDAIREFEVVTSSYDASFGRNGGAQVNVITRSGSNRWGGTAYQFLRNGALDAQNYFAPRDEPAPEYERYQFGGSAGGPLQKDRTFVFSDYEGMRMREGTTRLTTVPTLAERQGDFSASTLPRPRNPFTGQPFPGDRIPSPFVNPIGSAIAGLYPLPNRDVPVGNYVSSPLLRDDGDQFDLRVDRTLGAASTWTTRYSFADRRLYEPFSGAGFAAVPGFGTDVARRGQNLATSFSHVFSSHLVNEARVGWSRVSGGSFHENSGTSLNHGVGLPELSANPRDWGLSFITVSGYSPLGDGYNEPQESTTHLVQALDTITWTRGSHLVKGGIDLRGVRQDAYRDVQSRGFLTFTSQAPITGNALADLLLGIPALTGGATLDNPQRLRTRSVNLFVTDSIRLHDHVTLTAGIRYEVNTAPVDADDRATIYDPATGALVPVGTGGVPRGGYSTDRNNIAPRVGVAWTPAGSDAVVVRGGYGIYFDQSALAPSEGLYFSPPYFDLSYYFSLPGLPVTLYDPFPASYPLPTPDAALGIQRDFQTAAYQHASAGVQWQLGSGRAVDVAYVGSRGRNLLAARDINQPEPSAAPLNLRPDPRLADITFLESRARSRYDSLQVSYTQRLDAGIAVLAAYTLGKSTDDTSSFFASAGDANFPQDSNNPAERARSNFDARHRFSLAVSYALPFGPGRPWLHEDGITTAVLGGWSVESVAAFHSGRPFTVALLPEIDNSNTGRASLGFGANDRPNQIGDPALSTRGPGAWFNAAAFAFPPFGSFGDVGRNTLEGPGFANVNVGLLKHVPLGPRVRLQLRLEAFNLLNRTNFDLPDNFLGSPTFGQILSAGSPRRLQFGTKLLW